MRVGAPVIGLNDSGGARYSHALCMFIYAHTLHMVNGRESWNILNRIERPWWEHFQYIKSPCLLFLFLALIGFKRASTLSQDMLTCSIRMFKRVASSLRSAHPGFHPPSSYCLRYVLFDPSPDILSIPSIPLPLFSQLAFISFCSHSSLSSPSLCMTSHKISMIMGPCAGGAVYSPAMTDFIFMVSIVT